MLLKYKDNGNLEIQKGEGKGLLGGSKKRSLGGGIDMQTNVVAIEQVHAT